MKARQCTISLERASGSHALLLHVRDIVRNQFMVASGRQAFQYRRMLIVYHKNERIFNCVRVVNHNVYRQPSLKKNMNRRASHFYLLKQNMFSQSLLFR